MKTKILGISGKKQSGKNTLANYIVGYWMQSLGLIDTFEINEAGELMISSGNSKVKFDIQSCDESFRKENLDEFVRVYSFADVLKKDVCINILGLTHEHCYGSDNQKNQLTHLKWEDMPGVTTYKMEDDMQSVSGRMGEYYKKLLNGMVYHEPGFMTGREVMQFAGTEIFRKMYSNVWVDATIKRINQDNPLMAIICDTRFENEVLGIQKAGGKVGRLLRDIFKGQDQHESETALDNFALDKYDFLWDNQHLSILEQNELVRKSLGDIVWLPHSIQKFYGGS